MIRLISNITRYGEIIREIITDLTAVYKDSKDEANEILRTIMKDDYYSFYYTIGQLEVYYNGKRYYEVSIDDVAEKIYDKYYRK